LIEKENANLYSLSIKERWNRLDITKDHTLQNCGMNIIYKRNTLMFCHM